MKRINGHSEISIYQGDLTKKVIVQMSVRLNDAFPALPPEFFNVFSNRIKELGFSDERLTDSINYVIDNCVYPKPTIAQIISFDKNIEFFTRADLLKLYKEKNEIETAFKTYRPVRIGNEPIPYYAHVNDIEKYNLEFWNKETK